MVDLALRRKSYNEVADTLPVNSEWDIEHYSICPERTKSKSTGDAIHLLVKIKKTDVHTFECSWQIAYLNKTKVYATVEYNLDYFENKTNKVRGVINSYYPNEPFIAYLDRYIPLIQDE